MPSYKVLGIYSFSNNLVEVKLNDSVILKKEFNNIKSKNAIGIYTKENKKIGYLPIEDKTQIEKFKDAYKVSKLILNKDYPQVEISRDYQETRNYNCEFPWEKKLKYKIKVISINDSLERSLNGLIKYLGTKRIKIKRALISYLDENYINLSLETSKGIQTFYTVTNDYYLKNLDYYEELFEFKLSDNIFFRDLMIYRIENYYESNYRNIIDFEVNCDIDLNIQEKIVHNKLNLPEDINICEYVNLYFNSLFKKEKYLEKEYNLEDLRRYYKTLNLEKGSFYYNHKYKIYSWIEWFNNNIIYIITNSVSKSYLINLYLVNMKNIILYNPEMGKEIHISLKMNNYDYMNNLI
jgi:hypothetical protein